MAHRLKLRNDDFDVIGAVPRDLSVIKNFLKRDCAVKRLIDIEEEFLQQCVARAEHAAVEQKKKDSPEDEKKKEELRRKEEEAARHHARESRAGEMHPHGHPFHQHDHKRDKMIPEDAGYEYCDPCRRLKTSVGLEELTMPAITNPVFSKASPQYFDEETVMGNALPIKFRFRRKFNACDDERPNNLMSTGTPNTNVVVLTNCCDVMAWPSQRVAQMNRVPVTMLTGEADLTEYMLEEETIM